MLRLSYRRVASSAPGAPSAITKLTEALFGAKKGCTEATASAARKTLTVNETRYFIFSPYGQCRARGSGRQVTGRKRRVTPEWLSGGFQSKLELSHELYRTVEEGEGAPPESEVPPLIS